MAYDPNNMQRIDPKDLAEALAGTKLQVTTPNKQTVEVNIGGDPKNTGSKQAS